LNDLQMIQLEILKEFSVVAQREDLAWFVMFGTLLGAVRHNGFIPWDDDVDVALPREDYDRLRLSGGWFSEPYFLQTPQNDPAAAPRHIRLRRSDTTYLAEFPNNYTRGGNMGAYIDIFPLDDVPGAISARGMHYAALRIREQMFMSAAIDENTGGELPDWKAEVCYGAGGIAGMYSLLANRYEWVCSRYNDKPYYTIPVLASSRGARVYEKQWFSAGVTMQFEGIEVPVPSGWREVLVASYPDGLLEPEKEYNLLKQPPDEALIDLSCSYRIYLSRYTDMLVGIEGKRVMLFGAGDSLRIWMERYSKELNMICAFDNAESKWGTTAYGLKVRSPSDLPGLFDNDSRLIIASIYYKEISKQLDNMGIKDYYVFLDGWNYGKDSD